MNEAENSTSQFFFKTPELSSDESSSFTKTTNCKTGNTEKSFKIVPVLIIGNLLPAADNKYLVIDLSL